MVTDIGTDTTWLWICDLVKIRGTDLSFRARARQNSTQAKVCTSVEDKGSMREVKVLQVCPCSWQKVTSVKGLTTHEGKKRRSAKNGQNGRIDQCFLRSQSRSQLMKGKSLDTQT